jgi:hypothetical protein
MTLGIGRFVPAVVFSVAGVSMVHADCAKLSRRSRITARLRYGASQQPRVRGLHAAARTGWRGRRDRHRSLRKAHVDAIATNMMRGGRWKSVAVAMKFSIEGRNAS